MESQPFSCNVHNHKDVIMRKIHGDAPWRVSTKP